jgi:hypothetical protein
MIIDVILVCFLIFVVFFSHKLENFPFYEPTPQKRNMSLDLRCEPEIPKRHYLFGNSSIDYYYRPKCLGG